MITVILRYTHWLKYLEIFMIVGLKEYYYIELIVTGNKLLILKYKHFAIKLLIMNNLNKFGFIDFYRH